MDKKKSRPFRTAPVIWECIAYSATISTLIWALISL